MLGSPDQNGVVKIRNRTLMDMVRSMKSNCNLPHFLWTEALKTTMLLNRVLTKAVTRCLLSYSKVKNQVCDI